MQLNDGQFYKTLINLMDSPYSEVQYNSAGVIGHLAMDGRQYVSLMFVFEIVLLRCVEKYHKCLLENDPSVMHFLLKFMNSEETNFVHIALWIMDQFCTEGGRNTVDL